MKILANDGISQSGIDALTCFIILIKNCLILLSQRFEIVSKIERVTFPQWSLVFNKIPFLLNIS
jgi:hypothetical protein